MRAIRGNMKDHIWEGDNKILHCPSCGTEYSGDAGDYWYLPDDYVFICQDCAVEMELVDKIVTTKYAD